MSPRLRRLMASSAPATSSAIAACLAGSAEALPLLSRLSRLSDNEEMGVSEFIISCASTCTMSCHALSSTASRSPAMRWSAIRRCDGWPGTLNCETTTNICRPSASETIWRVPARSERSLRAPCSPTAAICSSRSSAAPARLRAARLMSITRPSGCTTMSEVPTVSSRVCR